MPLCLSGDALYIIRAGFIQLKRTFQSLKVRVWWRHKCRDQCQSQIAVIMQHTTVEMNPGTWQHLATPLCSEPLRGCKETRCLRGVKTGALLQIAGKSTQDFKSTILKEQ